MGQGSITDTPSEPFLVTGRGTGLWCRPYSGFGVNRNYDVEKGLGLVLSVGSGRHLKDVCLGPRGRRENSPGVEGGSLTGLFL